MNPRVVSTASLLIDLPITVAHLPERGGDVLGGAAQPTPGGGFNIVAAAARQGAEVGFLSPIGIGRNGELGRSALAAEGILPLGRDDGAEDTGFCVTLTEPDGERTFVTVPGAESRVSPADLPRGLVGSDDIVFVSGYDLCYAGSGPALAAWVAELPPDALVVFDPGPLVADIPEELLEPVLRRCDLCSVNEREAEILWTVSFAGTADPAAVARAQLGKIRARLGASTQVLLRIGPAGCLVIGESVRLVPSIRVTMVDATGAGDAHAGVLMARLAAGDSLLAAVYAANVAAALTVTRHGPATSPSADELERACAARPTPTS
ncbi:MAG: PfkB family carbohydrate kinase [Propioniciclava sp.]